MQKKDGKWFTRKKGAMLVLTLCLVGAAAATTYYAVDLSDTAQEPAKEHMVDLNESPVETEAEAVISSEAEANLASQANEMDVDPEITGRRQSSDKGRTGNSRAGNGSRDRRHGDRKSFLRTGQRSGQSDGQLCVHTGTSVAGSRQSAHGLQHGFYRVFCNAGSV